MMKNVVMIVTILLLVIMTVVGALLVGFGIYGNFAGFPADQNLASVKYGVIYAVIALAGAKAMLVALHK